MAIDIKIYNGVVEKWNVAHFATHVIYTLIEFDGGKKIGDVRVMGELNDLFEPALRAGKPLNIHVAMPIQQMPSTLVAFGEQEGQLFAADVPRLPFLFRFAPRLALIVGILLIPAFGIGVLVLGVWSSMRSRIRPMVEMREYVQKLPSAILVKC